VWWTIFTAADLYIGLIVLDAMALSAPGEKQARLRTARKIILFLLALCGVVLLGQLARRYGWLSR
jgi:uncharacterized membrane protein SirB2